MTELLHPSRHPAGYRPESPLVGRPRRSLPALPRQQRRRSLHQRIGGSPKWLSQQGRTIHTPADASELATILQTTVAAGDTILLQSTASYATGYPLQVVLKQGLGTAPSDRVTVIVEDYATNFTTRVRALIGTDDANCAHIFCANGGNDGALPILGGFGSYFSWYGIKFSAARAAGTTKAAGLVQIGSEWRSGSVYGGGNRPDPPYAPRELQGGTSTTAVLDATETIDWMNGGGGGAGARILLFDENYYVLARREIIGYNTETKTITVTDWPPGVTPTAGQHYSIGYAAITYTEQGKADFTHCLFDASDSSTGLGVGVNCLTLEVQSARIADCDFLNHGHAGDGETKCIGSTNSYGNITVSNCRLKSAVSNIMYHAYPWLAEGAHGRGMRIEYSFFDRAHDQEYCKNHIEIKGAHDTLIRRNVFKGSWATSHTGYAIGFSTVGNQEGYGGNDGHWVEDCYIYDCEQMVSIGGPGGVTYPSPPPDMDSIHFSNVLARVGYDPRTPIATAQKLITLSAVTEFSCDHVTVLGYGVDGRHVGALAILLVGTDGHLANLSLTNSVFPESAEVGYTLIHIGDVINTTGEDAFDVACGTGAWTFSKNILGLNAGDSTTSFASLLASNYIQGDGAVAGAAQALIAAMMDGTYQITDATKVGTDGEIVGCRMARLLARIDGVEAGVPTFVDPTSDREGVRFGRKGFTIGGRPTKIQFGSEGLTI